VGLKIDAPYDRTSFQFFPSGCFLVIQLLNVAEGEPWTGGEWTKIVSKIKDPRHSKVATGKRSSNNNGHDESVGMNGTEMNEMDTDHCKCDGDGEHGCMCDRKQRKGNQRLNWEIEHID
jgi:hypothetical protein